MLTSNCIINLKQIFKSVFPDKYSNLSDRMAKKKVKEVKKQSSSKEDKKVVTIKIPSINLKKIDLKYALIAFAILLAVSVFLNFKGGFPQSTGDKLSLSGLVYMCPPQNCDTSQVDKWSEELGFSVTPYEASWAQGPIGLLFKKNSVEILDVSTESGFYTSVCDSTNNEKACDIAGVAEKEQSEQSCKTLTKTNKPILESFVVSYCPYGLQMQRILVPVHDLLGDIVNIKIRYIGQIVDGKITAMHGDQEAQENLKQICLREEQADKFWDYLTCFMKAQGQSDACSEEVGVDSNKLDECMTNPDKGVKYAQVDFDAQNKYAVTGSPTLFQNGEKVSEFNFGGRTAEAVKTMLCCGMNKEATECNTELSTEQANTAFAPQYSSGSSTASGSC